MGKTNIKVISRNYRHTRIRKKSFGTAERPRLCVSRSLKNFAAQIVNDENHQVLMGMSTLSKSMKDKVKSGGNIEAAVELGKALGNLAKEKGITKVCFDRGGYLYHGRVKAFADAVREAGLEF